MSVLDRLQFYLMHFMPYPDVVPGRPQCQWMIFPTPTSIPRRDTSSGEHRIEAFSWCLPPEAAIASKKDQALVRSALNAHRYWGLEPMSGASRRAGECRPRTPGVAIGLNPLTEVGFTIRAPRLARSKRTSCKDC